MDIDIIILPALAIIALLLITLLLRSFASKPQDQQEQQNITAELADTREQNAALQSEIQSTKSQLDEARQEAQNANELAILNAKLETDLNNEKSLQKHTSQQLEATQTQRDKLQDEVNSLATKASNLDTNLENEKSLQKRTSQQLEATQTQRDKLQDEVNSLTAKVSNLNTKLENEQQNLTQRENLEKLFGDRFKTMSAETLENQQKHFIQRATETLKPLSDKVEKLDREWVNTSGAFKQQIETLANETQTLSSALTTKPQAKGQWGEMQVERALYLSGLTKGIHYKTQETDNKGGLTDFIVHMPHNRDIILDSKVSLDALVEAQKTTDEKRRNQHLDSHARSMQRHVDSLASKEYWRNLPDTADFVVMVVPEFALPPAVERRSNIIDRALQKNVVITSHSTLVALLKTVAMGWQERKLTDEANQIGILGRDLHDRLETFASHYEKIGKELEGAIKQYNKGVGSLEGRVLVTARDFPKLGIQTTKEIPEINPIETKVRPLKSSPADTNDNHTNNQLP